MRTGAFFTALLLSAAVANAQEPPVDPASFRTWATSATERIQEHGCDTENELWAEGDPCWIENHWLSQLSGDNLEAYVRNGPASMERLYRHIEYFLELSSRS